MTAPSNPLRIEEFGPVRAIGLSMPAKPGVSDFAGLWRKQLMPRAGEIVKGGRGVPFGICRCIPGATDGTFEYLAVFEAAADAPIPPGMVAVHIPRAHYAVFAAASYSELGRVWGQAPKALAAQTAWTPYCGPQGCRCAEYPPFEYYPDGSGQAWVYVPVSRNTKEMP
jgi:predicted transcriptional regulator YdeE